MIAVFLNPRSRANRRSPRLAMTLANLVGERGRLIATRTLEELDEEAKAVAAASPRVIAIHGGDGTLHKAVTALVRAFGEAPLPPIALLGGGTMNVVASSLGIKGTPEERLQRLLAWDQGGPAPTVARRRCLRVGDLYGFVFGVGFIANFLLEYYSGDGYGPGRALGLLASVMASDLVEGPLAERVFRPMGGRVLVDGEPLVIPDLTAVTAGTVREVGFGFKLNHLADDDPDRFAVIAIHAGPRALAQDLFAVHAGHGIDPARARSALATTLVVEPAEADTPYTVDGDIYRASEPLHVGLGPALNIVEGNA